eukprot:Colp12_sorted_trinity150504_noHs@33728
MAVEEQTKPKETPAPENAKKDKKDQKKEEELSEEDKQLRDELQMLVERLQEKDTSLYKPALESLRSIIRASTSSMTSVPKPLKFLRPHYAVLKGLFDAFPATVKDLLADVLSVLAMTMEEGTRESLKFRLLGTSESLGSWGHEYVRHLAGEIAQEYEDRTTNEKPVEDLLALAKEIVPYNMKHNAEAEACDLLMEIERLDLLEQFVDKEAYQRVCLYLVSCVPYVAEPEDSALLKTALGIFRKFDKYPSALALAIELNDLALVKEVFNACTDSAVRKQMAFMLGRQHIFLEDVEDDLLETISNLHLNANFLSLARELDIMEAKTPEDIYKSHLEPARTSFGAGNVDSARANLASTYVNAFVNAGFGQDKLMTEDGKWLYRNKDNGMLSAAASLGMILLWDVDGGLTQIDKYLYATEDFIKAGALLACGVVNCGVRNDCDPALALLSDYVTHSSNIMRVGSIMGLGLAYAGSQRGDIVELLAPVLGDTASSMETVAVTALAMGLISVSSCDGEVTGALLQCMMEKSELELKDNYAPYLGLALALTYLGKQEAVEAPLAALKAVGDPLGKISGVLLDACAYAGTGNVLKVQSLLHICSDHIEREGENAEYDGHQGAAVIGIALVAMGEEIGTEMALRSFNHLLQYGEPVIRRAVPLGLGLLCASNPKLSVLDTLSKLSHDNDAEVAHNSIFALGLVGAGTNNARIAGMLRQLASYYQKDANNLFMVRIAQGLLHLGKGTMTLSPYHCDRALLTPVALAGLLTVLVSCLDVKNTLLGKSHYFLYFLTPAIHPRMLATFDENLNPLQVTVRVGQAVDVVGQAGKPKTITGFQTHTTPVLLAVGERAELSTEEYIPLTPYLEGFVILKKNPDYEAEEEEPPKK